MKRTVPEEKGNPALQLYLWLQALVTALVSITLIFTFIGRITPVNGTSMEPTLRHGDLMLVQTIGYTPRQGDIVVLTKAFDAADGPIVKRVVATGGQSVYINYLAGTITVDGAVLEEPYLKEDMAAPDYAHITTVTVPEGAIFVMGDNRNHSSDSRHVTLGPVDSRYVIGGARFVFFPFQDVGTIC